MCGSVGALRTARSTGLALEERDWARHCEWDADEAQRRQARVQQMLVERRHVPLPHEAHPKRRLIQKREGVAVARRQHRALDWGTFDNEVVAAAAAARAAQSAVGAQPRAKRHVRHRLALVYLHK